MNTLTGEILTLPKTISGNVGAKTINIGGKGDDGATFIPSVSADGIISWTNDKDLPNPEPVNIKGAKGDKGDKGDRGLQGIQGIQGERGEQGQKGDKGDRGEQGIQGIQGLKGETGEQGQKGADGTPATHRWSGTTLYITSASGTSSANLKGEKGDKGNKGDRGEPGEPGINPIRGDDYWTPADKQEIVDEVLDRVPQFDWNQNDSSAADFIKNKPFGEFPTVLYEGTNLSPENIDGFYCLTLPTFEIVENKSHSVIIDGEEYAVTSILYMGMINLIGNPTAIGGEDNGLPFLCIPDLDTGEGMMFISFIPFTSVYISTDVIKKIEQKYLPASSIVLERNATDADNARYLYKTMNGEASERVTLIELREFANSGRHIYFNMNGMWYIPVAVSVYEPSVYGYVVIFMENGEQRKYYTAEYTA